jgi:hypothetical protein
LKGIGDTSEGHGQGGGGGKEEKEQEEEQEEMKTFLLPAHVDRAQQALASCSVPGRQLSLMIILLLFFQKQNLASAIASPDQG